MSILSGGGSAISPWGLLGQGVQDTINLGAGIWDRAESKRINEANLQHQKDVLAYQKDLQQQIFAREDNAVSRRAADMEAAGLSKALAAGGGAGAGHAVSTQAPHQDKPKELSNIMQSIGGIAAAMDISHTAAQTRHIKMQDKAIESTINLQNKQREMIEIDLKTRDDFNKASITQIGYNIRKIDEQINNVLMDTLNKSAANQRIRMESKMAELEYLMQLREDFLDIMVSGRRGRGGNFQGLPSGLGNQLDFFVRQWGGDQQAIDRYVLHQLGLGNPAGERNRGGATSTAPDALLRDLARGVGRTASNPRGSNRRETTTSGRGRSRGKY